jgi:hypothetical protein
MGLPDQRLRALRVSLNTSRKFAAPFLWAGADEGDLVVHAASSVLDLIQ